MKKSHQLSYWRPKCEGVRFQASFAEKDVEMTDSHLDATNVYPPLLLEFHSPILLPPPSPQVPDNVQKEIEAMDIEIPNIQEFVLNSALRDNQASEIEQDLSIIFLGQRPQPFLAIEERIPSNPQLSPSSQPKLTLALVSYVNPSSHFNINLNSETDYSNPVDIFLDAQGAQLSPTFSDHDLPLGQNPITPPHNIGQVMDPSIQ